VVNEPIDSRDRHGGIGEDLVPFAEGLVAGGDDGASLVALSDELEEDARLGLILPDVAEVVEDKTVEAVELRQHGGKREIAPGGL
jgi:hypothetical protein